MGQHVLEILVVMLSGRRYGLPAAAVRELVRAVAIERVPGGPRVLEGVVNFRGSVIPVYDLRGMLGLPAKELELSDHFVVFGAREATAALRVDRALDLIEAEIEYAEQNSTAPDRARVAKLPAGLVPLLDFAELLSRLSSGRERTT